MMIDIGMLIALGGVVATVLGGLNGWILLGMRAAREARAKFEAHLEEQFAAQRRVNQELRDEIHASNLRIAAAAGEFIKRPEFREEVNKLRDDFRLVTSDQTRLLENAIARVAQSIGAK